jgi:hypothetical protein
LHETVQRLRREYKLDDVVRGAGTEFEKILKLKTWVSKQWAWYLPQADYGDFSAWNALDILAPTRDGKPLGGMCLHYAIVFMQACQSFGFPARIVNANQAVYGGHEMTEVWSNDFCKWVLMDAQYDTCFVSRATGEPLNALELHRLFLDAYYPGEVLNRDTWTREDFASRAARVGKVPSVAAIVGGGGNGGTIKDYEWWNFSTRLYPYCEGYGFLNLGYLRFLPRSNHLSQPLPMPLNHGRRSHWGWVGYYGWCDAQTPPPQELKTVTGREEDLYGRLKTIDFAARLQQPGRLRIETDIAGPNFDRLRVTDNGEIKMVAGRGFDWRLAPGRNRLEMRVVDKLGNLGAASLLDLNFRPQ